jgi:hypothetical protein
MTVMKVYNIARATTPALWRSFASTRTLAAEGDTGAPRSGGSASR